MPLEILGIMVVVGLALVIAGVHFSGLSRPFRIDDAAQAEAMFRQDYPDELPGEVLVSSDGKVAFLALERGRTGLVHVIGARYLTRILDPAMVERIDLEGQNILAVRLRDFTLPKEKAQFASPAEAMKLKDWLAGANHA